MHVHLHAAAERRLVRKGPPNVRTPVETRQHRIEALVDSLERAVASTHWNARSHWSSYYAEQPSYGPEAFDAKVQLLGEWLARTRPATVWDIGANTGRFSRIAVQHGALVTAFDADPACVETLYRESKAEKLETLLPLVSDLTNPSPAIGWANEERQTLDQRGPADLALALALVHHLAIGNNVPLPTIAAYFARIGRQLIIEFVPKNDAMVQGMLAARRDVFDTYAQQSFEEAFSSYFRIEERAPLASSDRHLYLMTARR
jgi:ribosomal protein L11 methylase PrmA